MGGISTKEQTINMCNYFIVMGKVTFKIQKSKQDCAWWTTSIKWRTMSWGRGKLEKLESIA